MAEEATNLEELINLLDGAAEDKEKVTVEDMMAGVGERSFGALLLMAGLILATPLSGIPGLPTSLGIFVLLIAVQLLIHRKHFWMPQWILRRSVDADKFRSGLRIAKRPARWIDRPIRPRLQGLTCLGGARVVAVACIIIAATIPPLEILPFAATTAGVALLVFGLSLIAHDGLLALFAYLLTGTAIYLVYQVVT